LHYAFIGGDDKWIYGMILFKIMIGGKSNKYGDYTMKKKLLFLKLSYLSIAICLLGSLLLCSCTKETQPTKSISETKYGGTLYVSPNMDFPNLGYPPKYSAPICLREAAPAIETLFRIDETGKNKPWLAVGSKEDAANKNITLTLRQGVKFHDGTDFNAEAVKWNLEKHKEAKAAGTQKIKSIDVIDNYTVRVNLTEWDNSVSSAFSLSLGAIISPTACEKNGAEWAALNPVGTGPFKFSNWDKDVKCTFDRFGDYWQEGKPYLDRIEWKIIADSVTREISFRAGEIHAIMTIPTKNIVQLISDGFVVIGREMGSGAEGFAPSSGNPDSPWYNLKVRQAAAYAINNEEMVKGVYKDQAVATDQYAYPGHWSYNPDIVGYPYNPEKAKKLLNEAGYPNGFKTKMYCSTDPQENLRFEAVQGYLAEIGIICEMIPTVRADNNKFFIGGQTWDGLVSLGPSAYPDVTIQLATSYGGDGLHMASVLVPEDYLQVLNKAVTAPDFETKQKWVREALKLMTDTYCVFLPLNARYDHVISQKYVHDLGMQVNDNMLWTPEDCWLDK
jgi:peptide/nickel transport system substrate-binding protein